uniref:Spermidine/putrescine transport system permease protein n=1 Tax=Candidatus Kentrum sp. DK TaxID=2126562 RepID=A0A450S3E7_9GAMM|nr:MAG: spermidine/putrescine transport system permease protein [Candidatus Kentron sp. DK]
MRRARFAILYTTMVSLCYLAPLLYLTERSFHARDPLGGFGAGYGLDGWIGLTSPSTMTVLFRSLGMACMVTVVSLLLAVPVALLIRRIPAKFRRWVLLIIWLPLFMNSLLFAYGYVILLRRDGPLNDLLRILGRTAEPLAFLSTPEAVMLGLVSAFFSFCFIPVYAGLTRLEKKWMAVASDLGASPWQTTRWVLLPMLRPSLLAGAALVFIPMLGEFLVPDILGGGKIATYGTYIRLQFTSYANWPQGATLAVVLVWFGVGLQMWMLRRAGGEGSTA